MTMAGIFMVSRMSPLFEWSETALSVVLVIGAITALFMAFLGLIQNDIKRIIAYSTLSQLGYMTVALGASAYSAAMFHLMTHAFFKALLFLAAGSVIMAMHHEQDIRKMGGLRQYMPITYWTALIGSLALMGIPPFSGFFSKDSIIEAVGASTIAGSGFAYFAVIAGVFITAFYTMRLLFLTFHGKSRMDEHTLSQVKESPKVITVPLILLAIPSVFVGWLALSGMPFGDYFGNSIVVFDQHNGLAIAKEMHGGDPWHFLTHGIMTLPFWLVIAAIVLAWLFYIVKPEIPGMIKDRFSGLHRILDDAYGIDRLYYAVFVRGSQWLGKSFSSVGDAKLIDGIMVNGMANSVARFADVARRLQTGFLYHYAFAMIIGLLVLIGWFVLRP
ncbi:MAG: NADH-quinone oxidoreductase subunit L [Gammaproteobacteria bacterium]|nr:NADH-quinone oxidoreductase subunit L [Gammaproteobacteria bacterium]